MRRSAAVRLALAPLALVLLLAPAGCGDDDPEPTPQERAVPEMARPDTAAGPGAAGEDAGGRGAADTTGPAPAGSGGADAPDAAAPGGTAAGGAPGGASGGHGYTAQVASFLSPDSAQKWLRVLRNDGLPAWTVLHEVRGRPFHRLRVGVAPTVDQARVVGRLIHDRYEWPVWIAPVSAGEPIPEQAMERTRLLIGA